MSTVITDKIYTIVAEQLSIKVEAIHPESSIKEDLGGDSLDSVELVMALEDAFEIEITDEDAAKIKTIQDIIDHLNKIGQ